MRYDVVVCTRDRSEALAMSLPRMLEQTAPPAQVVVVDSSEDPGPVEAVVERVRSRADVPLRVVRSRPGLPLQRNAGLEHVTAPVVFFPDDDSLVAPDFAQQVMRVYEADGDARIVAVTGEAVPRLPGGWERPTTYAMGRGHRVRQLLEDRRQRIEHRLIPDPLVMLTRERTAARLPGWAVEAGAVADAWVAGFRMTFRSDVIRAVGFDVALSGYAVNEDVDAGFSVADHGLVVRAPAAKVFHYQYPSGRGAGRTRGATNIANRAYVVCKHSPRGSAARRRLRPYAYYRAFLYALGAIRSRYYREACRGALAAARGLRIIETAGPSDLVAAHRRVLREAGV